MELFICKYRFEIICIHAFIQCEECELIGAKAPEYSLLGDDITVKFTAIAASSNSNRTNDVRKEVRKENAMNARVLELISAQWDISMSEMADRLGVSYKTVQRAMSELKKAGIVERVGGRRNGYWKIKK